MEEDLSEGEYEFGGETGDLVKGGGRSMTVIKGVSNGVVLVVIMNYGDD